MRSFFSNKDKTNIEETEGKEAEAPSENFYLLDREKRRAIEKKDVEKFLANSYELKKLKQIMDRQKNSPDYKDLEYVIPAIEKSEDFSDILKATDHWEMDHPYDNLLPLWLGRNKMNALFFTVGFIHDRANFFYFALHLREKAVNVIYEKNYCSGYTYAPVNRL